MVARPKQVSIHASAREATCSARAWPSRFWCFNPRLRTGGDGPEGGRVCRETGFNPRLRTGGDPTSNGVAPDHGRVSIHASAREATCVRRGEQVAVQSFNPRLRTGGDPAMYERPPRSSSFNPRLRTGGDANRFFLFNKSGVFQSTPPHGRRRPGVG